MLCLLLMCALTCLALGFIVAATRGERRPKNPLSIFLPHMGRGQGEGTMTPTSPSRRDLLKGAAAVAVATSVGVASPMTSGRAHAQGSAPQSRARIDGVLKQAVDAREVPGVVAMAATPRGLLYEGAFGVRALDQGDKWEYGVNTDWVGRLVEEMSGQPIDVYFRERIFGPLRMRDSGYRTSDEQRSRQARVHQRQPDGTLVPQPLEAAFTPEFWSGGGPLYSTARDYLTFLQMLLHGGSFNGARILRPETVALMNKNHTGDIAAGIMKTESPARSNDVDLFPGAQIRWGLGYMLNMQPGPNGRSAGTVSWGGIFNTYYWIDPAKRVTGLIMTQILPFADQRVLKLYGQLESAVYETLKSV